MPVTIDTGTYQGTSGEQTIDIGFQPTKVLILGTHPDFRGAGRRDKFLIAYRPPGSPITGVIADEDDRILAEDPNDLVRRMAITSNGFRVIDHDNRVLTGNSDGATYHFIATRITPDGGSTQALQLANLRPGLLDQLTQQ